MIIPAGFTAACGKLRHFRGRPGISAIGRADSIVRPPPSMSRILAPALAASVAWTLALHGIKRAAFQRMPTRYPVLETNKCILCMECIRACPTVLEQDSQGRGFPGTRHTKGR